MDMEEMIEKLKEKTGEKKYKIRDIVLEMFRIMDESLKNGEEIVFPKRMGKLSVVEIKGKRYWDPQSGEIKNGKSRKTVKFISYHYRNYFKGRDKQ